ncbi:zinc finger protein 62-like [Mytilus edulis]|uniref:zinc finger protein 62-like n=1 Tax=Mytilus edulis TaxID=6550 RepID=UPI0039F046BE
MPIAMKYPLSNQQKLTTSKKSKIEKIKATNRKSLKKFKNIKSNLGLKPTGQTLVHVVEKQYKCKVKRCKHRFSKKSDLEIHLNTHNRIKTFTCNSCNREFLNRKIFKIHEIKCKIWKKRNKKIVQHLCKECGESFCQGGTYEIHQRSHFNAKPYMCVICGRKFILKLAMFRHISRHISLFECQTCKSVFDTPLKLEKHTFTHMDDLAVYKCLYCTRIMIDQEKFEKHLKFHVRHINAKHKQSESVFHKKLGKIRKLTKKGNFSIKKVVKKEKFDDFTESFHIHRHTDDSIGYVEAASNESNEGCFTTKMIQTSSIAENSKKVDLEEDEPSIAKLDCVLCQLSFQTISSFMQHVSSHVNYQNEYQIREPNIDVLNTNKTIFVCRCCDRKFANRKFAKDHISNLLQKPDEIHEQLKNEKTLDFSDNKYIFSVSIGNLKSIAEDSAVTKAIIYHCAKCSTNFESKSSLFSHVKNCKKVEHKYWCPNCNMNFETNGLLKEHIQMGHKRIQTDPMLDLVIVTTEKTIENVDQKISFECKKCGIVCNSVKDYATHRETTHNNVGPEMAEESEFVCAHCDISFESQALLYTHLQCHRENPRTPSKTTNYSDKMFHDRSAGLWICTVCNKSYSTKCNLTRHITLHDDEEKGSHVCPFCNRVFQFKRYLQHHVMYMHKVKKKGDKKYKCEECDGKFSSSTSLTRHKLIHTGEADSKKFYQCEYCNKKLRCDKQLKLHIRTHTGEKPFGCDKCSYRAAAYCNLLTHVKRVHENPIPNRRGPKSNKPKPFVV